MKTATYRLLAGLLFAGFLAALAFNASARPQTSADLLRQAYTTLASADHDYKGHRRAAMHQVEAAGKALGLNVRGDGRAREAQGISDQQLRTAQALLQQARPGLRGKPLKHLDQAIKQISVALSIK